MDFNALNKEIKELNQKYIGIAKDKESVGKERHLFGSAYTLNGHISFEITHILK